VDAGAIHEAERIAAAIKDCARQGRKTVPAEIIRDARKSPLSCYVAARLLWDPLGDTTRFIREFSTGAAGDR
jgi:hypothetical protein